MIGKSAKDAEQLVGKACEVDDLKGQLRCGGKQLEHGALCLHGLLLGDNEENILSRADVRLYSVGYFCGLSRAREAENKMDHMSSKCLVYIKLSARKAGQHVFSK